MPSFTVTSANLPRVLAKHDIMALHCHAKWSAPSKAFSKTLTSAVKRHPRVGFGRYDIDSDAEFTTRLHLDAYPSLLVFRENVIVHRAFGNLTAEQVDSILEEVLALDMGEVRRRLEEAKEKIEAAEAD